MPEMRFHIRWPDGTAEACYSPSLVVKDHLAPGTSYSVEDFRSRARTALTIASDRVEAKYGRPCSLALGQLARIETNCTRFAETVGATVVVQGFEE